MIGISFFLAAAILSGGSAEQSDKPFVHPLFTDDMVLQRNMEDPVWGWGKPGEEVVVRFQDQVRRAVARADGRWQTKIGPFPAGGPYELEIAGSKTVRYRNVMVGDVWICSGQSNMEMGVDAIDAPSEVATGNHPNLRLYYVARIVSGKALDHTPGTWKVCTPENLKTHGVWGGFSAVGYFFGRKIQQDLNVPVGLIHTSWGGTVAEAWTEPGELAQRLPEFRAPLLAVQKAVENQGETFAQWYAKHDRGTKEGWEAVGAPDKDWATVNVPVLVQQSGLTGFEARQSVIWLRKTVTLTAAQAASEATLRFVADDNDVTWVNGERVGATDGYNVPRAYTLPVGRLRAGENVIAVRVTDTQNPGGIWGEAGSARLDFSQGASVSLAGPWRVKLGGSVGDANPFPVSIAGDPNLPSVLYNGMIAPLTPFGVKGAIWYQGESNGDRGFQYQTLLPTMIESWRKSFKSGDFPFLIVQLAGWQNVPAQPGDDNWAELREAQFLAAKRVKNGGIATAIDIGEPNDIHPKNKQEVGRRLAQVALRQVYGQDVISSGPQYRAMRVSGSAIRLEFDRTDGGLVAKGGALKGFAIAGEDRKWHWAEARIEGNAVVVSSSAVAKPVAVRYGWSINTEANLTNGAGWPAFPFRTDSWKLTSDRK